MMKKTLICIGILLLVPSFLYAQNVNLVIQVNGKLVEAGKISNLYIYIQNKEQTAKTQIDYYPGDLILNEKIRKIIKTDSPNKFPIYFNYNTFKKNQHSSKTFKFELNDYLLNQPYLILNIYDFQNKKYKKWYQYLTKEDFLAELKFGNSGVYIRQQ